MATKGSYTSLRTGTVASKGKGFGKRTFASRPMSSPTADMSSNVPNPVGIPGGGGSDHAFLQPTTKV